MSLSFLCVRVAVCVGEFGLAVKRWQRGAEHKKEPKAFPLRKLPHSDFVIIYKKREMPPCCLSRLTCRWYLFFTKEGSCSHFPSQREMDKFILWAPILFRAERFFLWLLYRYDSFSSLGALLRAPLPPPKFYLSRRRCWCEWECCRMGSLSLYCVLLYLRVIYDRKHRQPI
jgi:hypothetical protein